MANRSIDTGGGAAVVGDVGVEGGDFVARDKITIHEHLKQLTLKGAIYRDRAKARATNGARHAASPWLSASTSPAWGVPSTRKRASRAANARATAAVPSLEPSSTTTHSQSRSV